MLRQPTLLLYSVSHKVHSEGQRPFSIIKRRIPIIGITSQMQITLNNEAMLMCRELRKKP